QLHGPVPDMAPLTRRSVVAVDAVVDDLQEDACSARGDLLPLAGDLGPAGRAAVQLPDGPVGGLDRIELTVRGRDRGDEREVDPQHALPPGRRDQGRA